MDNFSSEKQTSAIENPEIAKRIATAENDAFNALEENLRKSSTTQEAIIERLADKSISYDEKGRLQELLSQYIDLESLKGNGIDDSITEFLEKNYIGLYHSKLLEDKVVKNIEDGDAEALGHLLLDEKFLSGKFIFLKKLRNDEERQKAFSICKLRIEAGCAIIDAIDNIETAILFLTEINGYADSKAFSGTYSLESTGRRIAEKLCKAGRESELPGIVEKKILKLACIKQLLAGLGTKQELLAELAAKGDAIEAIADTLKYISDPELLKKLKEDTDAFASLEPEDKELAVSLCESIAEALRHDPEIVILSDLEPNGPGEYSKKPESKNKFIISLTRGNRYCIALGSVMMYKYHKDLCEAVSDRDLRGSALRSGGYVGLEKKKTGTVITIERDSGDFGHYSREVLERFRPALESALKKSLRNKKTAVVIKLSTG